MEVMSPVSKAVQMYNMNRLLVFMYREFRDCQKRGSVPAIRANELSAQFANVAEFSLRKRLKVFCDYQVSCDTYNIITYLANQDSWFLATTKSLIFL